MKKTADEGGAKLQSRYEKQGGQYSNALTGAEWTKYNHTMSTKLDAGLRVSENSVLVECEEDSDYQYKYIVYDNSFEDNPIKSVYAIGNIDYTIDDAKMVADEIYDLEESGYEQKYAKKYSEALRKCIKSYSGSTTVKALPFLESETTLPKMEQILKANPTEQEFLAELSKLES